LKEHPDFNYRTEDGDSVSFQNAGSQHSENKVSQERVSQYETLLL